MKYEVIKSLSKHSSKFSAEALFAKLRKVAKTIGTKTAYGALLLYYALIDKEIPLKDKGIVLGALGYFIFPFDFIPDIIGFSGYVDDYIALIYALRKIWKNITPETHTKARIHLESIIGPISDSDTKIL